jgi:XTP/dITP diphosphohydrolase
MNSPARLVFATTNKGKLKELKELVGPEVTVLSAADFPGTPEVVEDAPTFSGNAEKKARAWATTAQCWALADDSGLCVDALDGRPGVQSARYAETDQARIEKLLQELKDVPDARRTARFECALALVGPQGQLEQARGTCEGRIGHAPRGEHGFGYDPIFELPDGRTLAELKLSEKSAVSHRGQAFRALAARLRSLVQPG